MTAAFSFDGLLLLGSSSGDIAAWSVTTLRGMRSCVSKTLTLVPDVWFGTLNSPVISLAGALTRHVPAAGACPLPAASARFSPEGLVAVLADGSVLTAAWNDVAKAAAAARRASATITFRRWALGSHREVKSIATANPIASALFALPWEPADRFASTHLSPSADDVSPSDRDVVDGDDMVGLACAAASSHSRPQHAVLVAAGRDPSLAAYRANAAERGDGLAAIAGAVRGAVASVVLSLAGDARALRRVTVGLGAFVPTAAVSWLAGLVGGKGKGKGGSEGGEEHDPDSDDDADADADADTDADADADAEADADDAYDSQGESLTTSPVSANRASARAWRDTLPTSLVPDFSVADVERRVDRVVSDPSRRLVLATDAWGRVLLIDAAELLILRVWKGYRDAQVGWLTVPSAGGARAALCAVIYAPRRLGGVVEVWRARHGERIGWLRLSPPARLIYAEDDADRAASFPTPRCHIVAIGGDGAVEIREVRA